MIAREGGVDNPRERLDWFPMQNPGVGRWLLRLCVALTAVLCLGLAGYAGWRHWERRQVVRYLDAEQDLFDGGIHFDNRGDDEKRSPYEYDVYVDAHPEDEGDILLAYLDHHRKDDRRFGSIQRLGWLKVKAALPVFLEMLKDPDESTRASVACALGDLGDASAAPALLPLLEDKWPYVRFIAADAIVALGGGAAVPGLLKLSEHRVPEMRLSSAYALAGLHDARARPVLLQFLHKDDHEDDWFLRVHAAKALCALDGPASTVAIAGLLEDPKDVVRHRASELLEGLSGEHWPREGKGECRDKAVEAAKLWWARQRTP